MKKIYNILAMAFMAAIVLVSCSKEDPFIPGVEPGDGQGQVSMKKMFVEIDNEEAVVRSSVDVSAFIVTISNTTKIVAEYSYQDMPEILTLPVGDYTVNVKSHEVKNAAWDEPYFVGSQSFSVEANKITEVDTVVCKLSNVKVSVKYDSKLLAQMGDDCKVNVKIGQVGELNFEKSETRSGYFKYVDGSTTMIATFSGTVQGAMEENFRTYVDVAPGKHYIITYTLHSPGGNVPDVAGDITTGVNVDSYVTTENLTINVDDEEEILPDDERPEEGEPETPDNPDQPGDEPEDPVTPPAEGPTVEAVAPITFDAPNVVDASSNVVINVQSNHADGISEFKVKIDSPAISDLLNAQLGTSELDFINPASDAVANFINELNLVDGSVAGRTDKIEIKITGFMGMLTALGAGSHNFVITVGDANGSTIKTLTLVIQ